MKTWMVKKTVLLLLSVSLALGMNGVPMPINGSTDTEGMADNPGPESRAGGVDGQSTDAAGEIEARVTVNGETIPYTDFVQAWNDMQGREAEIYLLKSINTGNIDNGNGSHDTQTMLFMEAGNITLKMADGVKLYNDVNGNPVIQVNGGTFTLESGQICHNTPNQQANALYVIEGDVFIKGSADSTKISSENSSALNVYAGNAAISGGSFTGKYNAVECSGRMTIGDILANGYAFYNTDSNQWINDMSLSNTDSNVEVKPGPISFSENPERQTTILYSNEMPILHAKADINDPSTFAPGTSTWN